MKILRVLSSNETRRVSRCIFLLLLVVVSSFLKAKSNIAYSYVEIN